MPRAKKAGPASGGRTDRPSALPAAVVPSKQYGDSARELVQQRQVPMASGDLTAPQAAPGAPPASPAAPPAPPLAPGSVGDLGGPTQRPGEPFSHGADFGPGPGSESLGLPTAEDDVMLKLRALYKAFPLPEIADLIAESAK